MIYEYSSYQDYLRAVLEAKRASNKAFSMRALAKSLGVSPSTLSEVMAGKKDLSEDSAELVANGLKLPKNEKRYFRTLVQFATTKNQELKSVLIAQLRVLNPKLRQSFEIEADHFQMISQWYHFAINEMTYLGCSMHPEDIAQSLNIKASEAQAALELLMRLNIIEPIGEHRYRKTGGTVQAQSPNPNEALRQYHYQMLYKAQESLRTQTPAEKLVGSETFPIAEADLEQAKDIIENCFQQLLLLAEKSENRNHVYHVGIQMFKLTAGRRSR